MTEILLTYGWHGFDALNDMILQFAARDIWRDYTATMLNSLGHMFASNGWDYPSYHDMVDFEGQAARRAEEKKSGKQLQNELEAKLRKGGT